MKRLFIVFNICLILMLSGCSMKETKEYTQAERELKLYNERVEMIFNNYSICEEKAKSVENDLVSFFITAEFTENLSNISEIFKDKDSFMLFMLDYGDYNEYCLKFSNEDSQVFEDYMNGFTVEDCEIDYYMNSEYGTLVEFLTYVNNDTRILEVRIDWDEGEIKAINAVVKGESINEEDFFK